MDYSSCSEKQRFSESVKCLSPEKVMEIDSERTALRHYLQGDAYRFLDFQMQVRKKDTAAFVSITNEKIQALLKAGKGYRDRALRKISSAKTIKEMGLRLLKRK